MPPQKKNKNKNPPLASGVVPGRSRSAGKSAEVLRFTQEPRETRSSTRNPVEKQVNAPLEPRDLTKGVKTLVPPPKLASQSTKQTPPARTAIPSPPPESPSDLNAPSNFDIVTDLPRPRFSGIRAARAGTSKAQEVAKSKTITKSAPIKSDAELRFAPGLDIQRILDSLGPDDSDEEEGEVEEYLDLDEDNLEEDMQESPFVLPDDSADDFSILDIPKPRSQPLSGKRKGKKELKPAIEEAVTVVEAGEFPVKIWMEVEKIDHCVKLSNLARFGDVRQAVADKIGVGALSLSLVYRLDITAAAQKGNYREFGSQEDWDDLLEEARIHRNAQLKKKTGGSPDGWSIRMKMKLPTTGSNAATKKEATRTGPTPPAASPAEALTAELMSSLKCEPCGNKYCWVPGVNDLPHVRRYGLEGFLHIQITDSEMGKWVDELGRNATLTSPGPILAADICKRFSETQKMKKSFSMGGANGTRQAVPATPSSRFNFSAPVVATPAAYRTFGPTVAMSAPTVNMNNTPQLMGGSGQPKGKKHYPVNEWLETLQNSNRLYPNDPTSYVGMIPKLMEEGVFTTMELIQLGEARFMEVTGANRGAAIRVIAFATADRDE